MRQLINLQKGSKKRAERMHSGVLFFGDYILGLYLNLHFRPRLDQAIGYRGKYDKRDKEGVR